MSSPMPTLRKIPERAFFCFFMVFTFFGGFEYIFFSRFYVAPSEEALLWIFATNISVLLGWLLWALFGQASIFQVSDRRSEMVIKPGWGINCILITSLFLCGLYFYLYYEGFSFTKKIFGDGVSESERPDVSGALPHFYSYSILVTSFLIPCLVNYFAIYFKRKGLKNIQALSLIFISLIFSISLGNKSIPLIIIFYCLFFVGGDGLFKKSLLFFVMFFTVYLFYKSYEFEGSVLEYFLEALISVYRRVVVINTSAMGVAFDELILVNEKVPHGFSHINQYLFYLIYDYPVGGAPLPIGAEVVYYLGIGAWSLFLVSFIFFFFFLLRAVILKNTHSSALHANQFLFFYGAIILATASIDSFIMRSLLPMLIIAIASKIRLIK
ncbi:hypothetical protein SAMN02745148_03578 [Modicisalibacter ilicicola DSM 19980]|uniref:Oligosaccharide repeat unit polymerase n=1 Tax=Modicisalibacter ilicicola DSM 19980 TaxID=1121942 RepID=A0A1M5ENL8_9GAMM|nr:hypothetical protein [Halomonas ilicicola]SHF80744.1 hypothetical protein SAMN02745148_03578 [Halomonas ilicicola DSM 19980]